MLLHHWHQTAQGRQERGGHHITFIGKDGPVLVSDKILDSLVLTDSINLNHLHTGLSQTSLPLVAQHGGGFGFAPLPWFSDGTVESQGLPAFMLGKV